MSMEDRAIIRRRFNRRERVALYVFADGKCGGCGRDLPAHWHGDHQLAWSRGGATDVINGGALCPLCNLQKGEGDSMSRNGKLHQWQSAAIEAYFGHRRASFLLEATPGSGKTRVAGEIGVGLSNGDVIQRLIWVVPSRRLRKQTADAVRKFCGLQLNYKWENGDSIPSVRDGFAGIVVTYHAVGSAPHLYRMFCGRDVSTLVVLDECHHASENRTWGAALQEAFEPASRRLLLTGTPFRSDSGQIPFVRYVDGKGTPDFTFGYGEALEAEIVRYVYFPRSGGQFEWLDSDGLRTATFEDDLDDAGQSRRLRTALMVNGGHLPGMIRDAHKRLMELRAAGDADAAGLIIAMDQDHAREIVVLLKREFQVDPVLSISDEPTASEEIERFSTSSALWIVSVKMVSEGIDIPRLRVGVHATNVATELFFRQAVGRLVRMSREEEFPSAFYYIPDDIRLRQFAQDIRKTRDAVLQDKDGNDLDGGDKLGAARATAMFIPLSSTKTDEGAIAGDELLTQAELDHARRVKLMDRQTSALSEIEVALIIRNAKAGHMGAGVEHDKDEPVDLTAVRTKLAKANHSMVARIVNEYGLEYDVVNTRLNELVGIRTIRKCFDVGVLQRRLAFARSWLGSGTPIAEDAA